MTARTQYPEVKATRDVGHCEYAAGWGDFPDLVQRIGRTVNDEMHPAHGYKVEPYHNGVGPVKGAWVLLDPEGCSLLINGHGGIAPTKWKAQAEALRRIRQDKRLADDRLSLWAHLASKHATVVNPVSCTLDELVDIHTHEHDGPGTIRTNAWRERCLAAGAGAVERDLTTLRSSTTIRPMTHHHHDDPASGLYDRRYGSRYNSEATTKEIAATLRSDIRSAVKAGELPRDWKYSVRLQWSTHSRAIDIKAVSPRRIYAADPHHWDPENQWVLNDETGEYVVAHADKLTAEARKVSDWLNERSDSYNHDGSNSMIDYFDRKFWGSVSLDTAPGVDRYTPAPAVIAEAIERHPSTP